MTTAMHRWARVVDGVIAEQPFHLPDGISPADQFGQGVPGLFVECSDETIGEGWAYAVGADGKVSASPPDPLPRQVPDLDVLKRVLTDAASAACASVTRQVVPDDTHQQAYQNAATIVWGNGGKAPTADPAKSAFAAQAAALGLSADTFAGVVQSVSLVSLQLAALLSTLRGATVAATSGDQLSAPLATFEKGVSDVVASLNAAGLTVEVTAPDAIKIAGVNG